MTIDLTKSYGWIGIKKNEHHNHSRRTTKLRKNSTNPEAIAPAMKKLFSGQWKETQEIPMWDGKTAERIIEKLLEIYR